MDVIVFWRVLSAAVAAEHVLDYLLEHSRTRSVFNDFGRVLGPVVAALRDQVIGANVCGWNSSWEFELNDPEATSFRIADMACIALGYVQDCTAPRRFQI